MADLVQWLTVQLDADERIARAATAGPWLVDCETYAEALIAGDGTSVIAGGRWGGEASAFESTEDAIHIAAHDPARVLREIEAKRQLLADVLAEGHFRNEEDNWYSCAALTDEDGDPVCLDESRAPGPCDCGRDARVARRVRLLALPFEDRPGFAEAIASAE